MSNLLEQSLDDIINSKKADRARNSKSSRPRRGSSRAPSNRGGNRGRHNSSRRQHVPAEDKEIMNLSNGKPYLKLGNLHKELTESDIADLFSNNIGELDFVKIPVYTNGESKGYGYVCFADPSNNEIAIEKFDGAPAMDLPLSVSYGMPLESRIGINRRGASRDDTLAKDNKYRRGGNYRERSENSEKDTRRLNPEEAKARQQKALADLDAELENYKNGGANAQSNNNETGSAAADLDADLDNYRNSSIPPLSEGTSN